MVDGVDAGLLRVCVMCEVTAIICGERRHLRRIAIVMVTTERPTSIGQEVT